MAIGNMLKSALFKPDEEEPSAPLEPLVAPRRTITAGSRTGLQPSFRLPVTPGPVITRVEADPEMVRDIEGVLGGCRTKGYVELQAQLDALAPHIPDENARIIAALASLQALGLAAQQVRTSVQERIDVLNKHLGEFSAGLNQEVTQTKQQNETHLASVRARLRELSGELSRLQSEEADATKVLDEINERSAEVMDRFNTTIQPYFDELNGLIARIR